MRYLLVILCYLIGACTPQLYEYRIAPQDQGLPASLHDLPQGLSLVSAHRGGRYYQGYPENSIQAFAYTSYHLPAIIECDVRQTRDGVLVLLHDDDLDRTSTETGPLAEKTWEEIQNLTLVDDFGQATPYRLPSLAHALIWGKNRVIFTLDVKRGIPFEAVVSEVEKHQAENYAAIITYNWADAKKVHQLNPHLMISIGFRSMQDFQEDWKASGIPADRILAFTGYATQDPFEVPEVLIDSLHSQGIPCIYGRFGGDGAKTLKASYQNLGKNKIDIWTIDYPIIGAKALPSYPEQAPFQKIPLNK